MANITPEMKATVIEELAATSGISEGKMLDEWTKCIAGPNSVPSGGSIHSIKTWFLKHLVAVGIWNQIGDGDVDGNKNNDFSPTITRGNRDVDYIERPPTTITADEELFKSTDNLYGYDDDDDVDDDDDDVDDDDDDDDVDVDHDNNSLMVIHGDATKLFKQADKLVINSLVANAVQSQIVSGSAEAKREKVPKRQQRDHLYDDDDDYDDDDNLMAAYGYDEEDLADPIRASKDGNETHPGHSPVSGHGFGQDNDDDDDGNDDYDEKLGQGSQTLNVGRRHRRKRRLGKGRRKASAKRYALGKAIGAWAIRHYNSPAEKITDSGMQMGNGLALAVVDLDRTEQRKKRFPITPLGIAARHDAIVLLLIEGIDAAGTVATASRQYADSILQGLIKDLNQYSAAIANVIGDSFSKVAGSRALPSGSIWDRLGSLRKGGRRKIRALLNERDLRIIVAAILSVGKAAVYQPGEVPVPGFGRDADVKRLIRGFGRQLTHTLSSSQGVSAGRDERNAGASSAVIDFFRGATLAFITHPELLPFAGTLVDTALTRLGVGTGVEEPIATSQKRLPEIPTKAIALATTVATHAMTHINSPAVQQRRYYCGKEFVVMVPGNAQCINKVKGYFTGSDKGTREGSQKYIEGAVLTRHPNKDRDTLGYLKALNGTVFHLKEAPVGAPGTHVLRQMKENVIGNPIPHPRRLPMYCRIGDVPKMTLSPLSVKRPGTSVDESTSPKSPVLRILYYWPDDTQQHQ